MLHKVVLTVNPATFLIDATEQYFSICLPYKVPLTFKSVGENSLSVTIEMKSANPPNTLLFFPCFILYKVVLSFFEAVNEIICSTESCSISSRFSCHYASF